MRQLLAALCAFAVFASSTLGQSVGSCAPTKISRVALVIGNSQYSHNQSKLPKLPAVASDVQDVSEALKKIGFNIFDGAPRVDLDKSGMDSAIDRFTASIKEGDLVFVYFGGHGVQASGINYLLPVDATLESTDDLLAEGIRLDAALLRKVALRKPSAVVAVVDACRNNPFSSGLVGLASPDDMPANVVLYYSAAPGQTAIANSPFAQYLAEEMLEPNQPIEAVFRKVRRRVLDASNRAQRPSEFGNLTNVVQLRDAISLNVQIADADDDAKIGLDGQLVASWQGGPKSVVLALESGEHVFDIRVYNQKSFTGGLEGFGGHFPEGWRYDVLIRTCDGKELARATDREDRPDKDGPRFGGEFPASRIRVTVDRDAGRVLLKEQQNLVKK